MYPFRPDPSIPGRTGIPGIPGIPGRTGIPGVTGRPDVTGCPDSTGLADVTDITGIAGASDAVIRRPIPRAGVDRFTDPDVALSLVLAVLHDPPIDETVAILLDDDRCSERLLVVGATHSLEAVLDVVDVLAGVDDVAGLVVASSRPGRGDDCLDPDRWLEMSDRCDEDGIELVEWFVIDDGRVWCPRDDTGEPPRW